MSTAPRSEYYDYRPPQGHTGPSPASPQARYPGPGGYDDGYAPRHDGYDDRYERGAPSRGPAPGQQQQPPHFDPPPRDPRDVPPQDYRDPRAEPDQYYQSRQQYADYGPPPAASQYGDRSYAPSEPRPNEGNQIAPYDEEKAEAEFRRGYYEQQQQQQAYDYARQQGLEYDRRPRYDSRDRYYDERDRYDPRYDDRRPSDRYERERERERQRSRRQRDSPPIEEKLLRYPSQSQKRGGKDVFGGSEGERGLGATLAGAGGGALLGHEFADGALGTIGGAVAGALVAKVAENFAEKRKAEKELKRREAPYERPNQRDLRDVPSAGGGYVEDRRYGDEGRYASRDPRGSRGEFARDDYERDPRDVREPSRRRRGTRSRDESWSDDARSVRR